MSREVVRFERRGAVALVTLDRPDQLNAIDRSVVEGLAAATATVESDASLRAVVITGTGRAFCAGADIAMMQTLDDPRAFAGYLDDLGAVLSRIETLPCPVVGALNGMAFGGGLELALVCDLRVLADDASVGVPEIRIGVLPGGGGTQRLARLVPAAIATQMVLSGAPLAAADAHRLGLVNELAPAERVLDVALERGTALAELPSAAIAAGKALVRAAATTDLASGLELERRVVADLFDSDDRREGMGAFLDKRPARFHPG
ncbi:MAG: enoyl-CoA hydratase/isomerase family protein [Acidimicrobiia bacterium]|nr:enoyl-CoA hydratase/isomerase family protein [Acidimicrobiia bacterium]